jgi:hypothetical protein
MAWSLLRRSLAASVAATFACCLLEGAASAQPSGDTAPPPPAATGSAPVKIGTSDAKGMIYIDGKLVGEGSFVGDLPAGQHVLRITRDGFDTFEENIIVTDKEPLARTVTLKLSSNVSTGSVEEAAEERLEGLYGGFNFLMIFTPGGTKGAVQKICENPSAEVTGCQAPDGFGGGLGGFVGYHWDPVGVELFLAAQFDQRKPKVDYVQANTSPGVGPDPARHEEYTLARLGGMGLARARLTLHPAKRIRASFALGAGVVRRVIFYQRDTTSADGSAHDKYVSDTAGYWSPVVNLEPSIGFKLTKSVTVQAGLQVFFETPATFMSGNPSGVNPQSSAENGHQLVTGTITVPGTATSPPLTVPNAHGLTTRAQDLASNLQVFIGPFIGMMFGP